MQSPRSVGAANGGVGRLPGQMLEGMALRFKPRSAVAVLFSLLCGCTSLAERADEQARSFGFDRSVVTGGAYSHVIYTNRAQRPGPPKVLHVYIENDGVPWLARYTTAGDPTPARPLMLGLMALDPAPAVYLGRPCYFGMARQPPCTPLVWTHERYSEAVVGSMVAVVSRIVSAEPATRLVFFGHSGGGTLAMLMAERLEQAAAVVTLAGNLDVRAWTEWHAFTSLHGSLDPGMRPALAPAIFQRHYVGSLDRNVPPDLSRRYALTRPGTLLIEVPGVDHDCCWLELWPRVLRELEAAR